MAILAMKSKNIVKYKPSILGKTNADGTSRRKLKDEK